ncbi:MAG: acyl-CoA dehydrogenase family protein [Candidatus Caldarchaeum sp.]
MLSDEHLLIYQTAQKIGERFGRKAWLECAAEKRTPDRLWDDLLKAGLLGVGVHEGSGCLDAVLVQEGLAKTGIPLLQFLTTHFSRVMIARHGSKEQFEKFVAPTFEKGKKISFALTEPVAGSETWKITTLARKQNGVYYLSGQKTYITGARESDFMLVVARTKRFEEVSDKKHGLGIFVFESRRSGVTFEPLDIELYSPETQYTVYFDDVELTDENLVGRPDRGVEVLFDGLNVERMLIAACSVGLGDHVLNRAVEYGKQRVVFGRPVGSYQGLQFRMARAKAHVEAARVLNYHAANLYDVGEPAGGVANMAKLVAAEAGLEAFEASMQVFGGNAFDRKTDVITLYPIIRLFLTAPVTNELVLAHIGQHVLGLPKSY